MRNIIIIDGTSAIWKDQLIQYIKLKRNADSCIIMKTSNRKRRSTDKNLDLYLSTDEDRQSFGLDYEYWFAGKLYGFSKKEIKDALLKFRNVFIVVRNHAVINQLREDFKDQNVFVVFIYSDNESINAFLQKDIAINTLLKDSISQAQEDYYSNPSIYDLVTINGKSKTDFIRIIRHIISTAEMSNKTDTLNNISPKSKRPISIIISVLIPILCSFPIGIIVNAITGNESTKWVFISVVISVFWIVTLIVLYNYITSN